MSTTSSPIVNTQSGQVQGQWNQKDQIAVFKSIPYAKPPVGDLRWRPPQPAEPWEGVRKATKYGAMAIQRMADFKTFIKALIEGQGWNSVKTWFIKNLILIAPTPKEDEDCLHLSIRTPSLDQSAKLPVMVWIHGGDHHDGSSFDPFFIGNAISKEGIVNVSINYRLGLFGYFTHSELLEESPDGVCGNYGLLDQVAALEWVRDNIENFGGDPNNITLFGQSAGGESIANLMTTPKAEGLFHKAIMQSPANSGQMYHLFDPFLEHYSGLEVGEKFAEGMGVSGENQIEQLRNISARDLQKVATSESKIGCFYPVIDGKILPQSPFTAFHDGNQAKIPVIVGTTGFEGGLIHAVFPTPIVEYRFREMKPDQMPDFMQEAFGEDLDKLVALYPGIETRELKAEQDLNGDSMFGCIARFYAEFVAKSGQESFYYLFDRVPPSPTQTAGAFHGSDLAFVHGTNTPILPLNKNDLHLSKAMITYWTQFAKTGNPGSFDGKTWESFSPDNPMWMKLDNSEFGMTEVEREPKYQILNRRVLRNVELMREVGIKV